MAISTFIKSTFTDISYIISAAISCWNILLFLSNVLYLVEQVCCWKFVFWRPIYNPFETTKAENV